MNLEDIIEKIKRLENGGNGTNLTCFIVAFDFLYFLKDNDSRERFIHEYYKNDNGMFTANFKKVCNDPLRHRGSDQGHPQRPRKRGFHCLFDPDHRIPGRG